EVPLFTAMLVVESRTTPQGLTLPVLDSLERCICRVAEHVQRHPETTRNKHLAKVKGTLCALLQQYVDVAQTLRERLRPLAGVEFGLAVARLSEPVDYPLRCLRFLGYLATAGLACLDLGSERNAQEFANVIDALWESNDAACETPVTDDQLIELVAIW